MGFSPTVEIPTAIDTATDALTPSLPAVTATPIALEMTAHHSVDQHWRPAHDEAVLSAIVCTADRLIVSPVRCRSRSSRQADRRPLTTVIDPRIDASKPRVIDRRSPLTRPSSSAGRPTSIGHLGSPSTVTAKPALSTPPTRLFECRNHRTTSDDQPRCHHRCQRRFGQPAATTLTTLRDARLRPPSLPLSTPQTTTYAT